jgi:hypothetical protein
MHHAMKTYGGVEVQFHHSWNRYAHPALPAGKGSPCSHKVRDRIGFQSRSERSGEQNVLSLARIEHRCAEINLIFKHY